MRKTIKVVSCRLVITLVFILGLLLIIFLYPVLTYANKTSQGNYIIYHQQKLQAEFRDAFTEAEKLAEASEIYSAEVKLDICLNDGSEYPLLIEALGGAAFARGFYNKVVLMGILNSKNNYINLNGYKWNLRQLIAHELIHCYQYSKFGFWKSNPVANIVDWKWEGYEYVARQDVNQKSLELNIRRLLELTKQPSNGWIEFEDGTGTVIPYYNSWVLMQYCIDVKQMNYSKILKSQTSEAEMRTEMMHWFSNLPNK